jgi:hypothetical protein
MMGIRARSIVSALGWVTACTFVAMAANRPQGPGGGGNPRSASDPGLFAVSGECVACHNNLVSNAGEDVSIGVNWRGTIMAHSARDPYFQGSLRRELIDHPAAASEIENECAACHLPAAGAAARAAGARASVFAHLAGAMSDAASPLDEIAIDGVTCTVCHQIAPDGLGTRERFNGNFALAPSLPGGARRVFGPFAPDPGRRRIMHSVTGFEQAEGDHIQQSELCATCHTLITEARGPDGRIIGSLPEQMNYQEWRHSAFMGEGRSCQSCHMPAAAGPIRVSSVLGRDREQLARHTFLGGNAFMLRMMNRYRLELGIEATPAELDASARATTRQLEHDTASVAVERTTLSGGTLAFDVLVTNITGHKLPTGYPSRRVWLHVTARDTTGRVLFESGRIAADGSIDGNASDADAGTFEPHYREITGSDEVQIYESIMGTPAGTPTTGLLQATRYLKDNRLLPRGFDKSRAPAEIAVIGAAVADEDFSGGTDRVRYRLPLATPAAPISLEVELRFQPIAFRWAQNLAAYDAPEPKRFVGYFNRMAQESSTLLARVRTEVGP